MMDRIVGFVKRFWLLFIIVAGIVAIRASGYHELISFENLNAEQERITSYVEANFFFASLFYIMFYTVIVAFSLPVATLLTLLSGFLFGFVFGTINVVIGATLGAIILFIAAKTALAGLLRNKAGPWVQKMEEGFKRDAFGYLLFLRLVPAFPFFIVNLVPAFLGVRLSTFAITTFLGIIPGSGVYVFTGASVGSIDSLTISGILNGQVILAFVALGMLALVPIIYRKVKKA